MARYAPQACAGPLLVREVMTLRDALEDPDKPVLPIAHPPVYATYLSKAHGPYATLGLAEDTWALNAHILGDDEFLHQCNTADDERETMFFDALRKVKSERKMSMRAELASATVRGPQAADALSFLA